MILLCIVVFVALVFTYTNGFHDTANSIATVVSTKVLSPRQAIVLATITNLIGAMLGGAVASFIATGIVDSNIVPADISSRMLICALVAAIFWNLVTWYVGMPSSSSHALVGGLCGAALAVARGNWHAVVWVEMPKAGQHWWQGGGVLYKVIVPTLLSPLFGFLIAFVVMTTLYIVLRNWRPRTVTRVFGLLQLGSSAGMGVSHGMNDAQKTMGIIALALVAATKAGTFDHLPHWLEFLRTPEASNPKEQYIALWIKVLCALTMGAGTAAGGWRIIKTLGHKMVRLQPVHGFAAETAGAAVLFGTGLLGMPVSTTHVITTSIMGVGVAKRFSALKLGVVERIIWAWIMTIPASALVAYALVKLAQACHWLP
ncbi:MAG TPA: inorganic phosphate transporter [Dongiaceae bacterium]|jgi:PiT family inorganic phosphate transporter|nr:inorganic phosphate transporter [Dongiaceae bacterium]